MILHSLELRGSFPRGRPESEEESVCEHLPKISALFCHFFVCLGLMASDPLSLAAVALRDSLHRIREIHARYVQLSLDMSRMREDPSVLGEIGQMIPVNPVEAFKLVKKLLSKSERSWQVWQAFIQAFVKVVDHQTYVNPHIKASQRKKLRSRMKHWPLMRADSFFELLSGEVFITVFPRDQFGRFCEQLFNQLGDECRSMDIELLRRSRFALLCNAKPFDRFDQLMTKFSIYTRFIQYGHRHRKPIVWHFPHGLPAQDVPEENRINNPQWILTRHTIDNYLRVLLTMYIPQLPTDINFEIASRICTFRGYYSPTGYRSEAEDAINALDVDLSV